MTGGTREAPVNSSPAVAANAEGEEIEVLESTDVLPVAPEDVSLHTLHPGRPEVRTRPLLPFRVLYNCAAGPLLSPAPKRSRTVHLGAGYLSKFTGLLITGVLHWYQRGFKIPKSNARQ